MLSKNVNNKKCARKLIFFNEKNILILYPPFENSTTRIDIFTMGIPEDFNTWPNRNLRGIQCKGLNQSVGPVGGGGVRGATGYRATQNQKLFHQKIFHYLLLSQIFRPSDECGLSSTDELGLHKYRIESGLACKMVNSVSSNSLIYHCSQSSDDNNHLFIYLLYLPYFLIQFPPLNSFLP